jgi:hypothetical protein
MEKAVIEVLRNFFESQGIALTEINLKLTNRGQVEYVTGRFQPSKTIGEGKDIAKVYRKALPCTDYRFHNTELTMASLQFIIN